MNTEEQYAEASQHYTVAIITFVLYEIAVLLALFVMDNQPEISTKFLLITFLLTQVLGALPVIVFLQRVKKWEAAFWKEVATLYGYTYIHHPYFEAKALMFREGVDNDTGHGLVGTLNNSPFRLFQYKFTTGSGKNKKSHSYCVFEIGFSGTFPHIYLNNTNNYNLTNLKGVFLPGLTLPSELEKSFDLHCPKEYEIETLEILTPDLLIRLLDMQWKHDLELVDQKLYIFREKPIRTKQDITNEIERIQKLLQLLTPKLNRLKLTPIGDHKSTL